MFEIEQVDLDFVGFVNMLAGCATKVPLRAPSQRHFNADERQFNADERHCNADQAQRNFRQQMLDYREAFVLFDADGGGSISVEEFADGLIELGTLQLTHEQLTGMIGVFGSGVENEIDFVQVRVL